MEKANDELTLKGNEPLLHIRIHDLRHSHATVLASNNVPIPVISARFGHSSIAETMKTYIHLFKGDDQRAVDVIDSVIDNLSDKSS